MSIFNSFFGGSTSSKKIFKTRKEVRKALFKISSLTSKERKSIYREIIKELDDGGVSAYEGREKLNRIFYRMVKAGEISSTDYRNLKKLWQ